MLLTYVIRNHLWFRPRTRLWSVCFSTFYLYWSTLLVILSQLATPFFIILLHIKERWSPIHIFNFWTRVISWHQLWSWYFLIILLFTIKPRLKRTSIFNRRVFRARSCILLFFGSLTQPLKYILIVSFLLAWVNCCFFYALYLLPGCHQWMTFFKQLNLLSSLIIILIES